MWPFDLPEIEESVFWDRSDAWATCSLYFKDKNYNAVELCKYDYRISLRINDISIYSGMATDREENNITSADIINVFTKLGEQMVLGYPGPIYINIDRNFLSEKVFNVCLSNSRNNHFLFKTFCLKDVQAFEWAGRYIQEVSNFIPECITRECPDVAF